MLVIRLQPNEGMNLMVMIKEPGPGGMRLMQVPLDMSFADALGDEAEDVPDAYERLIMDVIRGNQTLFMRGDEVEAAWAWTDPIIEGWEARGDKPQTYDPGSSGPEDALMLMHRDGRRWREITRMKLETYPDREMLMLGLANTIAGQLARFPAPRGPRHAVGAGRHDAGADLRHAVGRRSGLGQCGGGSERRTLGAEDSPTGRTPACCASGCCAGKAAPARLVPLYAPAEQPEEMLAALDDGLAPASADFGPAAGHGGGHAHRQPVPRRRPAGRGAVAHSAPILLPMRAEAAGEPRITLTAPVLRGAFNIHILITGPEKRAALERAQTLTPLEAPVRAVLDNATVHWAE